MKNNRQAVFNAAEEYFSSLEKPKFTPGETYIPPSGKVLDGSDLKHLIDASLDMWLTAGRFTDVFEQELAYRFGTRFAKATVSGSAANLLAFSFFTSPKLHERRITKGSEVITVAAGFPTTVAPIIQNNCVPVFVDIELSTANINVEKIEAAITDKTRAIMVAHTLGNPMDLDVIKAIADKYHLHLIEDCCDAFGAKYDNKNVGTFGDVATLSFYPAHHITTGEGGAVMTNKKSYATLIESFRDWGRDCWCAPGKDNTCEKRFDWQLGKLPKGYDHKYIYAHLGYNLKITDMQGALGLSQLQKLDSFVEKRRYNFNKLKTELLKLGLEEYFMLPDHHKKALPSWFGFLLILRDNLKFSRRDLTKMLEEKKVGTRLLFAGDMTLQPAFQGVDFRIEGSLDNTRKVMQDAFWIGVWPGITDEMISYMAQTIKESVDELTGRR